MNIKGLYETGVNSLACQLSVISTLTTKDAQATMWTYHLITLSDGQWPGYKVRVASVNLAASSRLHSSLLNPRLTHFTRLLLLLPSLQQYNKTSGIMNLITCLLSSNVRSSEQMNIFTYFCVLDMFLATVKCQLI